jgi:antitoxin HicB
MFFLADDGMLEEVTAVAVKRVIARQIEQEMSAQKITKTEIAKKMRTSRASLNHLLDESDTSLTLTTLAGAAAALGQRITALFIHLHMKISVCGGVSMNALVGGEVKCDAKRFPVIQTSFQTRKLFTCCIYCIYYVTLLLFDYGMRRADKTGERHAYD